MEVASHSRVLHVGNLLPGDHPQPLEDELGIVFGRWAMPPGPWLSQAAMTAAALVLWPSGPVLAGAVRAAMLYLSGVAHLRSNFPRPPLAPLPPVPPPRFTPPLPDHSGQAWRGAGRGGQACTHWSRTLGYCEIS